MKFKQKIQSRKFIVFISWTVLIVLNQIFKAAFPKELIEGYTWVSVLYIGGETVIDTFFRYLELKAGKVDDK